VAKALPVVDPRIQCHYFPDTPCISKYGVYIQIKVKTELLNISLKKLHVFFNNLSLKLLLIPKYIKLNKCMQCISCKVPVICVASIQW
jgi:hypothetical protein